MSLRRVLIFLAAVLSMAACGRNASDENSQMSDSVRALVSTVPSDALAICCRTKTADAVSLLDSTQTLAGMDYGRLQNSVAVISWSYNGHLVPTLAIEIGRSKADQNAARLCSANADSLGLHSLIQLGDTLRSKRSYLIITPSDAQLNAVRRHISEGRSIFDASGFENAAAKVGNERNFTILRAAGIDRLVPRNFLGNIYSRQKMLGVLKRSTEWATIVPESKNSFRVTMTSSESSRYSFNMFEGIPAGDSRLGRILPPECEYAIAMNTPLPEFREAYDALMDANVLITPYRRRFSQLKSESRRDPREWEKSLNVREVGLARIDGQILAFVRPAKAPQTAEIAENAYKGFISALYGDAFSIADDSWCATKGEWLVFGPEDAVRSFCARPEPKELAKAANADSSSVGKMSPSDFTLQKIWPAKGSHIVVYKSGSVLSWNKKGILLWNSNQ